MAERKSPTDAEIREAFGDKVQIQRAPGVLSEEEIRAIVRDEVTRMWKHDADHGSLQSRREAQRARDRAAGIDGDDAGDM